MMLHTGGQFESMPQVVMTFLRKVEQVPLDVRSACPENDKEFGKKKLSQEVEHIQIHNWTTSCVWRSKRPLLACYTCRKCSIMESNLSQFGKKVKFDNVGMA